SLGVAAAHGLPDARGRARDETLALARRLGGLPCPFTVDIEAGFSDDPAEVAGLAAALRDTGAAGINLEDGRADVALADPHRQCDLIAAVKAQVPGLFLNARIDTYWLSVVPSRTAETLARAERYLAAGADGIFVPGVAEDADIDALVTGIAAPLNVLYLPGRHSVERLTDLGVRRISTGSLLFRTAVHAAVETALAVRDGRPVPAGVPTYADIQRLSG
ncbi:MAG: isocitrate lyase/PEP mutase family protein, partial [Actinomadura sp.]